MNERVDTGAPQVIVDWLESPYNHFSAGIFGSEDMRLLDIAAGENKQRRILTQHWKSIISLDASENIPGVCFGDITQIPLNDDSVDWAFCFETIEHLAEEYHDLILSELSRVCKIGFVIGSVNLTGPNFLGPREIWKADKNPYHKKEYGHIEWKNRIGGEIWGSYYEPIENKFEFRTEIGEESISNYSIIRK